MDPSPAGPTWAASHRGGRSASRIRTQPPSATPHLGEEPLPRAESGAVECGGWMGSRLRLTPERRCPGRPMMNVPLGQLSAGCGAPRHSSRPVRSIGGMGPPGHHRPVGSTVVAESTTSDRARERPASRADRAAGGSASRAGSRSRRTWIRRRPVGRGRRRTRRAERTADPGAAAVPGGHRASLRLGEEPLPRAEVQRLRLPTEYHRNDLRLRRASVRWRRSLAHARGDGRSRDRSAAIPP